MTTKIESITIITQSGTKTYTVGETYNDLLLDHIKDRSVEYPDSLHIIYCGYTVDGSLVFEIINAPIDVKYY